MVFFSAKFYTIIKRGIIKVFAWKIAKIGIPIRGNLPRCATRSITQPIRIQILQCSARKFTISLKSINILDKWGLTLIYTGVIPVQKFSSIAKKITLYCVFYHKW